MHQNASNGSFCFKIFLGVPPCNMLTVLCHHNLLPCLLNVMIWWLVKLRKNISLRGKISWKSQNPPIEMYYHVAQFNRSSSKIQCNSIIISCFSEMLTIDTPQLSLVNEIWGVFGLISLFTLGPFRPKHIVVSCTVYPSVCLELGFVVTTRDCNPYQTNADVWYWDSKKFLMKTC